MCRFIPLHEVTFETYQQFNENKFKVESVNTKIVKTTPTHVNIELVQQIIDLDDYTLIVFDTSSIKVNESSDVIFKFINR